MSISVNKKVRKLTEWMEVVDKREWTKVRSLR